MPVKSIVNSISVLKAELVGIGNCLREHLLPGWQEGQEANGFTLLGIALVLQILWAELGVRAGRGRVRTTTAQPPKKTLKAPDRDGAFQQRKEYQGAGL